MFLFKNSSLVILIISLGLGVVFIFYGSNNELFTLNQKVELKETFFDGTEFTDDVMAVAIVSKVCAGLLPLKNPILEINSDVATSLEELNVTIKPFTCVDTNFSTKAKDKSSIFVKFNSK